MSARMPQNSPRRVLLATFALLISVAPVGAQERTPLSSPDSPVIVSETADRRFGTLRESIFGRADGEWTPLRLSNFGEGFFEPWVRPPNGSSGAPRQGWLNSFDGHFTREHHLGYFFTSNAADGRDGHLGLYEFQTPLSRRLFVNVTVPFIAGLTGGPGPSRAGLGDLVIVPRVMLHETQDLSVSSGLGIRIPTGRAAVGSDQTSLFPSLQFWSDIGNSWTLRGGIGVEVPLSGTGATLRRGVGAVPVLVPGNPDASLITNLAVGRTWTPHDRTPFGDFATYVAFNMRNDFVGDSTRTTVSLAPGIRTHLGNNLFFLAAVDVPLTGPRPFDERFLFLFVKGF
jgi:hypothetical protein